MRRIHLAALILVTWLVMIGWQVRREYFQPELTRLAEAALSLAPGVNFYTLRLGERFIDPTHGPAHFYRGEALNRLGRVDEALETMERTIQLQPGNWRAYHTLGVLFDRKNDRERASEMYRHARELNRL